MPLLEAPLATVEDVQRFYEAPITPESEPRVQALLNVAESKLLTLRPGLRAALEAGTLDPDLVVWALASAVLRVLRNPAGYASETVGDLSYRLNGPAASGVLTFTAEELAGCTPASRSPLGLVGSARLAPPSYGVPGGSGPLDPWAQTWR